MSKHHVILTMNTSQSIAALAAALAKAQGEMQNAKRDQENPYFKSRYADLASVWDSCRGPLAKNGLSVIQTTRPSDVGVSVITTLAHASGEWISGEISAKPTKSDPQGLGSCMTYLRRYALAAIVGVAPADDDDGNAASRPAHAETPAATPIERLMSLMPNKEYAFLLRDYLRAVPGKSGNYGLLPDQELEAVEPALINYMVANWPKVMESVEQWSDQISGAEVPHAEDWKSATIPFAPKAHPDLKGKPVGELLASESEEIRNYTFGLLMNYEAKPWTGRDGKSHPPGSESVAFEKACLAFRAERGK